MNQREFVERYEESWRRYESLLLQLDWSGRRTAEGRLALAEFPVLYRRLAQQLALARDRGYSPPLVARLNDLLLRGHHLLHRAPPVSLERIVAELLVGFPRQLRRDWRLFALASALLYLPAIVIAIAGSFDPALVQAVLGPAEAASLEEMYDPASDHFARERDSDSDFLMFGFYIRNNIGIGFQTFAGGLAFGIGSIFYLVFNGVFLGAATTHLFAVGYGGTFSAFVITHGAFELTAIAIAGAAGLKLGFSLLAPGRRTRLRSLEHAARESATLVFGMTAMLLIAAFVEAFWSSSTVVPAGAKYAVGTLCWVLVALHLGFVGRGGEPR